MSRAYDPIYFVVFILVFGFASGLWMAAMVSGFVITGLLCWFDFRPQRRKAAAAIFLLGLCLSLLPAKKDRQEKREKGKEPIAQIIRWNGEERAD